MYSYVLYVSNMSLVWPWYVLMSYVCLCNVFYDLKMSQIMSHYVLKTFLKGKFSKSGINVQITSRRTMLCPLRMSQTMSHYVLRTFLKGKFSKSSNNVQIMSRRTSYACLLRFPDHLHVLMTFLIGKSVGKITCQ